MKKSTIEEIEKEIDEKTKLPIEIKDKIKKYIFINIIVAVAIITYFIFIVLGSFGSIKNVRVIDLNIFSILFLTIAIVLFEISYRKKDGMLAIHGIESLAVAIFTLFLPYIIFELDEAQKKYYLIASIYIASYYILKSIYISTKIKSKYMDSISDVKEIVKKEKPKRKAKKNIEENKDIEDTNDTTVNDNNKNKIKEQKENIDVKESTLNKNIKEDNTTPKKRGRPKKEVLEKESKEKNSTSKKRGRPKKIEIDNIKKSEEGEVQKKRGRPKKVGVSND